MAITLHLSRHVRHICAPHIPVDGGEKPIRGGGTGVDA